MPNHRCNKCLIIKELTEFYDHKDNPNGKMSVCQECYKASMRERKAKNRSYYKPKEQIEIPKPKKKMSEEFQKVCEDMDKYEKKWKIID